jgi:phosphonate transport system substrate-binding protein
MRLTAYRAAGLTVLPALLSILCLSLFGGCGRSEPPPRSAERVRERQQLLMGLIPEQNIFNQLARYEPLAHHLSKKIGMRVTLKVLSRYGNIVDNFRSAGLDGAFFGSFTYVLAHEKLGVEVLARPESSDGSSSYHGLIFVRKDSGIASAEGMKGKRFAFVDKATTAGFLLPMEYFRKHGIGDYQTYFGETYFTGTHEGAIDDVLSGKADVGAAKNTVFDRLAGQDPRIRELLVVLATSPDVPENGFAVRKDLDESVKSQLKEALLAMHDDPEGRKVLKDFGAARFVETTNRDYAPVYRYAREIRLDFRTYDYVNH